MKQGGAGVQPGSLLEFYNKLLNHKQEQTKEESEVKNPAGKQKAESRGKKGFIWMAHKILMATPLGKIIQAVTIIAFSVVCAVHSCLEDDEDMPTYRALAFAQSALIGILWSFLLIRSLPIIISKWTGEDCDIEFNIEFTC